MIYIATSTTRPANPVEGMLIYETDTDRIYVCTVGGATPTWREVYPAQAVLLDYTVPATTSSVSLGTGLTYFSYRLYCSIHNPTATGSSYLLYFNGDTTNANYYNQQIYADGVSLSGVRENNPAIVYVAAYQTCACVVDILNVQHVDGTFGSPCYTSTIIRNPPASVLLVQRHGRWTTGAKINSLAVAGQTAQIGANSRFTLMVVGR